MRPLDYGRSFVLGNGPENEVRLWVESRTRITDEVSGVSEEYIQTGSCKSEEVFVTEGLFKEPNYDFMAIYGPEDSIVFRRLARTHEHYRQRVASADFFGGQNYHLVDPKCSLFDTRGCSIYAPRLIQRRPAGDHVGRLDMEAEWLVLPGRRHPPGRRTRRDCTAPAVPGC